MKPLSIATVAVVCLSACAGSYAIGRTGQEDAEKMSRGKAVKLSLNLATRELSEKIKALHGTDPSTSEDRAILAPLRDVASDPVATQVVVSDWLGDFFTLKASSESAAQASQVASEEALKMQAIAVEQNARIIQLLERLTEQRKEKSK
jgi:hypothetical protein